MQWPSFPVRRRFAVASLALGCLAWGRQAQPKTLLPWQAWPDLGLAEVTEAPTGDTLTLADRRTVHLAGLRAPRQGVGEAPAEPGFDTARDWLGTQTRGHIVRLYGPLERPDRFGRLPAHVVVPDQSAIWLQQVLLTAGMTRVFADRNESAAIVMALLEREAAARALRRGLWREPAFTVRRASLPETIPAGFQLVEGRVLAIGESGSSLFLNFGPDWRQDFTAFVERSDRDGFAGGLRGLKRLQGRHVRVRGAVFRRGGPAIRVRTGHAIEVLEDP